MSFFLSISSPYSLLVEPQFESNGRIPARKRFVALWTFTWQSCRKKRLVPGPFMRSKFALKGWLAFVKCFWLGLPSLVWILHFKRSLLTDAPYVGVSIAVLEVHLAGEEHGQVVAQPVAVPVAVYHLTEQHVDQRGFLVSVAEWTDLGMNMSRR